MREVVAGVAKKTDKAVKDLTKEVKKLRKQNEKLAETIGNMRENQAWANGEILSALQKRNDVSANTVDPTPDAADEEEEPEVTDAAERRAKNLDVDLADVEGTGSGGRILVEDVETVADEEQ